MSSQTVLIVQSPFVLTVGSTTYGPYRKGDTISDPAAVDAILQSPAASNVSVTILSAGTQTPPSSGGTTTSGG